MLKNIKYILVTIFFVVNAYSFNDKNRFINNIKNKSMEICKIKKNNNLYCSDYDDINLNNLTYEDAEIIDNMLSYYLYKNNVKDSLFNSGCFLLSTVGFSLTSALTFYILNDKNLNMNNCSDECPTSMSDIDSYCYNNGLEADCASYYLDVNNQTSLPPFPNYIDGCSSSLPRAFIGKTIPYQTPQDICENNIFVFNTLKGGSLVPAIGSFCGLIFHGGKLVKNQYCLYTTKQKLIKSNTNINIDENEPKWFKDIMENVKELVNSLKEKNKINV